MESRKDNVDPTLNVKELIEANVKRLDDLQKAFEVRIHEKVQIHMMYAEKLRDKEAERINEIFGGLRTELRSDRETAVKTAQTITHQVSEQSERARENVNSAVKELGAQISRITGDSATIRDLSSGSDVSKGKWVIIIAIITVVVGFIGTIAGGIIMMVIQNTFKK